MSRNHIKYIVKIIIFSLIDIFLRTVKYYRCAQV